MQDLAMGLIEPVWGRCQGAGYSRFRRSARDNVLGVRERASSHKRTSRANHSVAEGGVSSILDQPFLPDVNSIRKLDASKWLSRRTYAGGSEYFVEAIEQAFLSIITGIFPCLVSPVHPFWGDCSRIISSITNR
jgi:hypothetical protein